VENERKIFLLVLNKSVLVQMKPRYLVLESINFQSHVRSKISDTLKRVMYQGLQDKMPKFFQAEMRQV